MYPARWFPVNGYTTDRFTAEMNIAVPPGYKVLGTGHRGHAAAGSDTAGLRFQVHQPSFPGSIAVVKGAGAGDSPRASPPPSIFRGTEKDMAQATAKRSAR